MKRILSLILSVCLLLGLCACGGNKGEMSAEGGLTWQEQYDLGIRYLSEGNYEEAIIAFTAAIEIDPKRPEGYLGLAEAFTDIGDVDAARKTLEDALEQVADSAVLEAKLEELASIQMPLEGYPKTERQDWDDGRYMIWEYDQYGNGVVGTRYTADGEIEYRIEYTYDERGAKISSREQWYSSENAQTESVAEYDSEGRPIQIVEYWKDDTKTFFYTYNGKAVAVDMVIVGERYGEIRDSFSYTLSANAHYMEIWGMGYSEDGIDVGHIVEFDAQGYEINDVEFWED